jgi:hypothetical protein
MQFGQTFVKGFVERAGVRGAPETVPEPRAAGAESTVKKNGRSRILSHEFGVLCIVGTGLQSRETLGNMTQRKRCRATNRYDFRCYRKIPLI